MTSDNDDPAAITPAKRPRPSEDRTSPGSQNSTEARTPLGNLTATSDVFGDEEFHLPASARTTAPNPNPPSITIESAYERPPNESSTLKTLKGTRLEPLRALLAPLPERFSIKIVALSKATLDLSQKIKQQEASASRFDKPIVERDDHGNLVIDEQTGEQKTSIFIPRSIRDKNPVS